MIRRTVLLVVGFLGLILAHAEDTPSLTAQTTAQPVVESVVNSTPTTVSVSTPTSTLEPKPPVASAPGKPEPCGTSTSLSDKWTVSIATANRKLELLRVGTSEIKTIFEWHQANCAFFYGWTPDDRYFYFDLGAPLNQAFVLVDQKDIHQVDKFEAQNVSTVPVLTSPALYPFPSGTESSFVDNRFIWLDKASGTKIHRTDLVLGRTDVISEGKHFSVAPDGANMIVNRGSELTFKDLVNGAEVILDPIEKVNHVPSTDWNKGVEGYVIGGWKTGGTRFWYRRTAGENTGWTVLINRAQIVLTNVDPKEHNERVFNLENGWLVETVHVKSGEAGLFQTVKPEEGVLTIMGLISGNITEVARSEAKEFVPKFVNEGGQIFLEYTASGEINRVPARELRNKVEAAFLKKSTFVKSSVLKNLRK